MKKLSKTDIANRDEIIQRMKDAWEAIETEHQAVTAAVEAFNEKIDAYNEVLADAQGFCSDVTSEIDSYMSGRSEKWLDSEAGQEYYEWHSAWENMSLDDVDHADVPDLPEVSHIEELEEAPTEPSA